MGSVVRTNRRARYSILSANDANFREEGNTDLLGFRRIRTDYLFAIWSVLLVGWLYRRNIGVFVLWCVISQLALYLFFEQTPYQASDLLTIVSINALLLLQFWLAQRYYPALKYVFIVAITALSVASVFGFDAKLS